MSSTFVAIVTGLATGLAASVVFWWLQAKLLRARIIICPDLRLITAGISSSGMQLVCEFVLINRSRFAAADVSIKANFSVPGLLSESGVFDFYMRDLTLPWMEPGSEEQYIIGPKYLLHEGEQQEYSARLTGRLGKPLDQLDMRQLMEACTGSYVTVFVASNHAFSGARSFKRAVFTKKDFISAENVCVRADCCQTSQARWSNPYGFVTKLVSRIARAAALVIGHNGKSSE
jgi:hypothetical protein